MAEWGLSPHRWGKSFTEKHIFTHIIWEMTVFTLDVQGEGPPEWAWRTGEEREKYPMPTAEKLRVGEVTNMYVIVEKQMQATKVIRP